MGEWGKTIGDASNKNLDFFTAKGQCRRELETLGGRSIHLRARGLRLLATTLRASIELQPCDAESDGSRLVPQLRKTLTFAEPTWDLPSMYDAFMWNWLKFALCDHALFITTCINYAFVDEI